jgi:hypothetical protein
VANIRPATRVFRVMGVNSLIGCEFGD